MTALTDTPAAPVTPRPHAEMNWMDLSGLLLALFTFGFLTPIALILAWSSHAEAKKAHLRQHATGTVAFILGAIGTFFWALFLLVMVIGAHSQPTAARSYTPASAVTMVHDDAPSQADKLRVWYAAGGQNHVDTVTRSLTTVGTTGQSGNTTALVTACGQLAVDTAAAHNYTPMPDAAAQQNWSQALTWWHKASQECVAGVPTGNVTMINQAAQSTRYGTEYINRATARVNEINR